MSLRFIYGRAGSGKSHFCLNDIKSRIDGGATNPLILLVPEQYSLQAEKNLIKALGNKGIIKAEVLSFRRLAYRVFDEVGGITFPRINPASKCMIIYKILEKMKDHFKIFSKASKQQGFVNTISDIITEFKKYNVTPLDIEKILCDINDNNLLKSKLNELNSIYAQFEWSLEERYRDADDDLSLLSEKLERSNQFIGAEVWIDEFSGFTPQEYKVVGKLIKKAGIVNMCLCLDCIPDAINVDNTDIFSPVKNVANKILTLAKEADTKVELPIILKDEPFYRFKDSSELVHLEKYFFSFPYSKYSGTTKDISIFSSVNIYSEIEDTAREIVKLCRDFGLRYKDIAVVSGNLENYEKLIGAIFTDYSIPFFIDKKVDITDNPIVQLISSMFEIFLNNWSYEAVFSYLKTGLTGIKREDIDKIENYVLACGIRGSKWTEGSIWNFKTEMTLNYSKNSEEEDDISSKLDDIKKEIVKPLIEFREKTKGRKKASEICSALYVFLCSIGIPERIEEFIDGFRKDGQLSLANEYGQVWNIVIEVFDRIVEVMGEESIGIERFSEIIRIGLGEYKIGLIPPSLDQILVGSIERSKNHEVKALYILGVNDGIFPACSDKEGVLSDRDRENLRAAGLEIAKDTRTKAFEEQYLIYTTLTTAGRYLRLSYPIADNEGRSMRPSIVISRFRKIFPEILEYSNIINNATDEEAIKLITNRIPTFNELVSVLRKRSEGFEVKTLWWDVYRWYVNQSDWLLQCDSAKAALNYTNQVIPVDTKKVRTLYGNPAYSSITRFEKYSSCPFSYFVQYGLKAKERKIYMPSPMDVGTFLHGVIENFSKLVSEGDVSWREFSLDWCNQTVSNIVDVMLENMQGSIMSGSTRYLNLARRLKRVVVRAVWLIAEHIKRSSFEPIGYEMGFGDGEQFPSITIELPKGDKINLTGKIDRIDAFKTENGTYLRIVDYKSGNKAFRLSDVYYGMQIQLITYLDAIWENGGKDLEKPLLPGGMLYFRIDDPIVRGNNKISEEDVEKAIIKQLKMKGLLLADVKLIKEMDNQIDGYSNIIPARINKGDVLGKSSAVTMEQFDSLRKYVRRLLQGIGEEMLKGDISIKPYKNKRTTPCLYCSYTSVCQFDPLLKDNKYKMINDKSDEEVWDILKGDTLKTHAVPPDEVCPLTLDEGGEA